jgi:hypothetical protein
MVTIQCISLRSHICNSAACFCTALAVHHARNLDSFSHVETFQQHQRIEYIYLSLSDIPELLVPIRISWKSGGASKEAIEPRDPSG